MQTKGWLTKFQEIKKELRKWKTNKQIDKQIKNERN